jgi:APA family basic amino acid/polyamine antiporter
MSELKRTLGPVMLTLMGVGVILGAGIYALVGKAAALGGDAVWMSFIGSAVVASFTGLSYAELSSFIPRAGGEYHYTQRAFGPFPAFLVSWLLLGGMCVASGAVALGFGGYLGAFFGWPPVVGAVGVLIASAALLLYGTKESARFAVFCTLLEVLGLIVVIAVGVPHLGEIDLNAMPATGWTGVAGAAALIFFAFIGFEEIVQLAEESRNPTRDLPRALVLSIIITTVLYVLVAFAALAVLGAEKLGASDSPLADVVDAAIGWEASAAIAIIALFSTANTVLVLLLSCSRLLWGMAEDGALPGVIARVGERRQTPWLATVAVTAAAAGILAFEQKIEVVANLTNIALFVAFLVINASVIALRFKEPDVERPFRLPLSVAKVPLLPLLGIASVLALMVQTGIGTLGIAVAMVAVGVVIYALSNKAKAGRG